MACLLWKRLAALFVSRTDIIASVCGGNKICSYDFNKHIVLLSFCSVNTVFPSLNDTQLFCNSILQPTARKKLIPKRTG